MIVDSQVHIWGTNTTERPWPPNRPKPHRPGPFTKDDLLRAMDAAGVHRVVIIPPSWEGERNDLALEAARAHPDRFAVMGRLDADAPGALDQIATWRQQPGMLGLRFLFKVQGSPTNDKVWTNAEKAGVPIMMSVPPAQLQFVDSAAQQHPALKLVIDHLGIPSDKTGDEAFANLDQLLTLAKRPNIAVKVSSLPSFTSESYPYRELHPHIHKVYDAFGPKRMFWGTDFTRLPCSYRQAITMFTEEMPWLSAEDQEWIMGRGLCEWIGWPLP